MGSHLAQKALRGVGSCLAPRAESTTLGGLDPHTEHAVWSGLSLTSIDFHDFHAHKRRIWIYGLSGRCRRSSLVVLPSSPLPKAVSASGRFRLALTPFSLRFLPYLSRAVRAPQRLWLQRRPSQSRFLFQGVLHRRRTPPRPPVRSCPSLPCLALQPLHRRRRADEQQQQPVMHPRCKLWIRARRGPSTICPECQHPAANPTAAADPVDRRDPCSCRLSGLHGTDPVRP